MSQTTITPEIFADVKEPDEVSLSHDGSLVVYSLRTTYCRASEHVLSTIWMAETGRENSARQLTRETANDHSPTFSPDGKYIAFLSDRAKPGTASDLYLLPLRVGGGEALQLTPTKDKKPISGYKWSPDGSRIAYLKPKEDGEAKQQKEKDKDDAKVFDQDWDLDRLQMISVATKDVQLLAVETADVHVSSCDWNPSGTKIVFTTTRTSEFDLIICHGADIKVVDLETQVVDLICSTSAGPRQICWTSQTSIVWLQFMDDTSVVSSQAVFEVAPMKDSHPKYMAYGVTDCACALQRCSGQAVAYIALGLRDQLQVLPSASVLFQSDARLCAWDVKLYDDEKEAVVAIIKGETGVPAEVFSVRNGKHYQLSSHGKSIADMKIGTSRFIIESTAADGTPLDGFYCVPTSVQDKFDMKQPLPTLVVLHGGPYWRSADGFAIDLFSTSWFMAQNYLVLVANYRGGQGHGNNYASVTRGDPASSYQDVIALVQKGVEDGHVDRHRTGIFGWSQGGYLSYLAATRDSTFHFAAVIAGAGVTDWTTMTMTSDLPTFEGALGGGVPWLADTKFIEDRQSSPIYHMKNIKTPMLLLHGEDDARVPLSQAISFYRGMKARGLECELVIYPRESHGASPPFERQHFLDAMTRMQKFLKKHLG